MDPPPARDPVALTREGGALIAQDRLPEAEAVFRELLAAYPHHPVAVWNLGLVLIEQDRPDEALELAQATVQAHPRHGRALLLLGDALMGLDRPSDAAGAYAVAAREPEVAAEALSKLGLAHMALHEFTAARAAHDRAVALAPDDPVFRFRRGVQRLQSGDFGGWADYEGRLRSPTFLERAGMMNAAIAARLTPIASVDDVAGRRVLVIAEQGSGDQVMFASLLPDLAAVAASVTFVCERRLVRLFRRSFPAVTVMAAGEAPIAAESFERIVAIGSLGQVFRRADADFPGRPYLAPDPMRRAAWAERLGPRSSALRVGIAWRGGLLSTRKRQRSLSLDQLQPIFDVADCEFVSLQHGDVAAELAGRPVRAFAPADTYDFDDLAALAAEMDVIVSVQTALVHVCGAIGQDCLAMVPHNAEWRYGAEGPSMPWYRSVRLHRQPAPGDWAAVVDEVAQGLRARLPLAQRPSA